jgi:hypothetical protein
MTLPEGKTTCAKCEETVRQDRVNADGVCVNCLALAIRLKPEKKEAE